MIPVILCLPALVSALALAGPEPIHFPLVRRQQPTQDLDFWAHAADNLRHKYGVAAPQRRQSTSSIPMTNQVRILSVCVRTR
jgi:hypothetical protein